MKKLYWRPQRISIRVLLLVALVAVVGLVSVETFQVRQRQPYFKVKMKAARLARHGFDLVKAERLRRKLAIDPEADPAGSGLIGVLLSPVTTNPGHLPAKQTAANPNFAAVVVHLLKRAGVEEGDVVAVGMSGSFPAINIAVMAALEALKVKPMIISSVGSSQWGANQARFMWPDMESHLVQSRLVSFGSMAATRGGIDDRALGVSKKGRKLIDAAIKRNDLEKLEVANYKESVEKRMALYRFRAGDDDIKAYINIGGGTTSVGTRLGKRMFRPGLNRTAPRGTTSIDSVMTRFVQDGVPVIHMSKIDKLAQRYGLPLQPTITPSVGEGKVFAREVHNTWLAVGALLAVLFLLFALVRIDWGYRVLSSARREAQDSRPRPMV